LPEEVNPMNGRAWSVVGTCSSSLVSTCFLWSLVSVSDTYFQTIVKNNFKRSDAYFQFAFIWWFLCALSWYIKATGVPSCRPRSYRWHRIWGGIFRWFLGRLNWKCICWAWLMKFLVKMYLFHPFFVSFWALKRSYWKWDNQIQLWIGWAKIVYAKTIIDLNNNKTGTNLLIAIGKKGAWFFQALSSLPLSRLPHQLPCRQQTKGKNIFEEKIYVTTEKEEERQRGRQLLFNSCRWGSWGSLMRLL